MPRSSIWINDQLYRQVKDLKIEIGPTCRAALEVEVLLRGGVAIQRPKKPLTSQVLQYLIYKTKRTIPMDTLIDDCLKTGEYSVPDDREALKKEVRSYYKRANIELQ